MTQAFSCCYVRRLLTSTRDNIWTHRGRCHQEKTFSFDSASRHSGNSSPLQKPVLFRLTSKCILNNREISNSGIINCDVLPRMQRSPRSKGYLLQNNTTRLQVVRYASTKQTHYEVLGVSQNSSPKEIRSAFIKQSKQCHPDVSNANASNHTRFVRINEAYSVLSKTDSRREYDQSLALDKHFPEHSQKYENSAGMHQTYRGSTSSRDPRFDEDFHENPDKYQNAFYWKENAYRGVNFGVNRRDHQPRQSRQNIVLYCLMFSLMGIFVQAYNRPRHGGSRPQLQDSKREDHRGRIE